MNTPKIGFARGRWGHQGAIKHFLINASGKFDNIGLYLIYESTPTEENLNDVVPDLMVLDPHDGNKLLLWVEVTTTSQLAAMRRKCIRMMERFPDTIFYLYDYKEHAVYVYDKEQQRWLSSKDPDTEVMCAYINEPMLPLFVLRNLRPIDLIC